LVAAHSPSNQEPGAPRPQPPDCFVNFPEGVRTPRRAISLMNSSLLANIVLPACVTALFRSGSARVLLTNLPFTIRTLAEPSLITDFLWSMEDIVVMAETNA
jgi:hypothetical protein